jgi:hypothetical protein
MKRQEEKEIRFAVCVNNGDYPASLELHKIYRVLPDEDAEEDGDMRVVDESGEDYLYPADYFVLVEFAESDGKIFAAGRLMANSATDNAMRPSAKSAVLI